MHPALRRLVEAPIAHRGLHGCGRPGGPVENSIGAARAAIAGGFGIECDVVLSRDGEALVFHDHRLERLTTASGDVADHDAAMLTGLALGDSDDCIPTLDAFLAAVAGQAPVVVEIKSGGPDPTERTLDIIADYDGPIALESFDPAIVRRCLDRRSATTASYAVGLVGPAEDGTEDAALIARCDFLSWSIADLPAIADRHPALPLTTWTVRTSTDRAIAARCRAQIVFEGFIPGTDR